MDKRSAARIKLLTSMCIWGSIGLFVRNIPLPSSVIANFRGIIGLLFLLLVMGLKHLRFQWEAIRRNALYLGLSGLMLGFNWILLFEAYRFTTIAAATLCYYLAPMIVVALSPFVFGESLNGRKLLCVLAALGGMVLVSGVLEGGLPDLSQAKGVLLGLAAACLYAAIVICNKKLSGIGGTERTAIQLGISALVLLPYNLLSGSFQGISLSAFSALMLLVVGVVHTGFAYYLYFGSMEDLKSQTLAILSYIDPVVAVLLSALLLGEKLGLFGLTGAVLILGAAIVSELPEKQTVKRSEQ